MKQRWTSSSGIWNHRVPTVLPLCRYCQVCSVLELAWNNNGPVKPEDHFMSNFSSCLVCCWAWTDHVGVESCPPLGHQGCLHGLQVGCLSLPACCSSFCLVCICTTLLLKRFGLEDNKSPGEAVEMSWRILRMRRTICQELHGFGYISLRVGEREALKDFKSLMSFRFSVILW